MVLQISSSTYDHAAYMCLSSTLEQIYNDKAKWEVIVIG